MPHLVRHLSWVFAIALVAGGCSTFGPTEVDLENLGEPPRRGPANEPASVTSDAEQPSAEGIDEDSVPITVQATDLENRLPKSPAKIDGASPQIAASRRTLTTTDIPGQPNDEQSATFDQLMVEARSRGALSAAEETSFRRDMADVPAHLRPQMAAMLLAMQNRQSATSAEVLSNQADESIASNKTSPNPGAFNQLRSTPPTDRIPQLNAIAAAESLEENPLRALAEIEASRQPKTANGLLTSASKNNTANSASNVPGEVGIQQPKSSSGLAWPKSSATTSTQATQSESTATPTRRASLEATSEEWQVMLGATIHSLESKVAANPDDPETPRRQALLRLLYLTANRLDDTAKVMPADASEQQFWIDWLYGTSVYLDAAATPNDGQRAAIAAEHLRDAVQRLCDQANLVVNNMAFCRRVSSFGVYEPFTAKPGATEPNYEFTANQEVLLYAEVQNYTSVPTAKGHHTLLRPSYQIFDAQGRRLGSVVELDESHDYCQRPRTDFFVCYHIYLPTRIDPGAYKLKLTIEDVHGSKVQENSIDFTIKRG